MKAAAGAREESDANLAPARRACCRTPSLGVCRTFWGLRGAPKRGNRRFCAAGDAAARGTSGDGNAWARSWPGRKQHQAIGGSNAQLHRPLCPDPSALLLVSRWWWWVAAAAGGAAALLLLLCCYAQLVITRPLQAAQSRYC